jgi:CheY-like chemotaxis protein
LLMDLGHEVLEASSGQSALELLKEHPDVELLITDQAMPNMTGTQLAEHAIRINPNLAIILATGYGELPRDAQTKMLKLGKPFDQGDLAKALSQAVQLSPK